MRFDNNKLAQAFFSVVRGSRENDLRRGYARASINGFEEKVEVNSLNIFELDAAF